MLAQVLFSGLALGSIYGLVALGFVVIFKATDVFNFAQGMFVVCGAYLAVTAISCSGFRSHLLSYSLSPCPRCLEWESTRC
jgi:branched-chain amino acid transport system permease protein